MDSLQVKSTQREKQCSNIKPDGKTFSYKLCYKSSLPLNVLFVHLMYLCTNLLWITIKIILGWKDFYFFYSFTEKSFIGKYRYILSTDTHLHHSFPIYTYVRVYYTQRPFRDNPGRKFQVFFKKAKQWEKKILFCLPFVPSYHASYMSYLYM